MRFWKALLLRQVTLRLRSGFSRETMRRIVSDAAKMVDATGFEPVTR